MARMRLNDHFTMPCNWTVFQQGKQDDYGHQHSTTAPWAMLLSGKYHVTTDVFWEIQLQAAMIDGQFQHP